MKRGGLAFLQRGVRVRWWSSIANAARYKALLAVAFALISLGSGLAAVQAPSPWQRWLVPDPALAVAGYEAESADDVVFVGGFEVVHPPVIVSMPPMLAVAGMPYAYLIHALDPHGGPLLHAVTEAPEDMLIDPLTGLIEWLPESEGIVEIGVKVRSIFGMTAIQSYPLEVLPAGTPVPVITSDPLSKAIVLRPYAYDPIVTNPSGSSLTFSMDVAPAGMSISPSTGAIRWMPSEEGRYPVSFRVQDAAGRHAVQSWWLDVIPGGEVFTVGGEVTGMKGGALVLAESVSGQVLTVQGNGSFQFSLTDGSAYQIVIESQPVEPAQRCWVEQGTGQLNGADVLDVRVGCLPSSDEVDGYIAEAQEELDSGRPPTTTEEFESSEFGQAQMETATRARRARAHALAMAAIDPDPDWFGTELERDFVVARPGETVSIGVEKLDGHGESLGPVPAGQLTHTVRIQREDGVYEWLPTEFSEHIVQWSADGARLVVQVPPDLSRGRLLIGVRPNLPDPGQRALAERWSAALTVEVWPSRAGVVVIDPSQVLFPMAGAQPLSAQSAFTPQELQSAMVAALDEADVFLPLLLAPGASTTVGQQVDYRVDGRPYGGRVVSTTQRAGQTLAMLEPTWLDVYDVAEADDGFLVAEGVLPEHVVYRVGGPVEGFDAEYREDLLTLDDEPVPVVPEGTWAVDPVSGRARSRSRSAHALFIGGCGPQSASLTFSPHMSLSPLDLGVDISVGASSVALECVWTSSNQGASVNFMRSAGPLGLLASALVGSEVSLRPFGEVRFAAGASGLLVPAVSGFSVGVSVANGTQFNLGIPGDATQANDLAQGIPIVFSATGGVAGGFEVQASLVSPRGLIGWLLSVLGDVDTEIGVTARTGVNLGIVVEGANAKAVYQNGSESRGAGVVGVFASLDASNIVNRIAELLGGQGDLSINWEAEREVFRFAGEYSAGRVRDDGQGNAYVENLVALPGLAAFLGLNARGWMGPDDQSSSIFNDAHSGISYDVDECASSGGTITAPVIACAGMFCGRTDPVEVCGGELWVGPLSGSGQVGQTVSTTGAVGVSTSATGSTEPVVALLQGQPLVPQQTHFMIAPGETETYSARAECSVKGVQEGIVKASSTVGGRDMESVNLLSCRCRPGEPDCDRTWGSPHLVTGDGLAYDYYASGDHVLQRIPGMAGLEVQGRFLPGMGVSWPQATAMQVGSDVVEIHGVTQEYIGIVSHRLDILVNGRRPFDVNRWQPLEASRYLRLPGGGMVFVDRFLRRLGGYWVDPSAVTVIWPKVGPFEGYAARVSVMAFDQGEAHSVAHLPPIIDITLHRSHTYAGQERGMMGTNDGDPGNDLTRRNGQVIDVHGNLSWTELYALFGGDWLVRPGECLFRNGCIEPGFPAAAIVLSPEQRAIAEVACSGLIGWYREACIHDVGLIGSVDVVQGLYAATSDLNQMATRITQPGVDVAHFELIPGDVDTSGPTERHSFEIGHISGVGEYLLFVRPPRGASAKLVSNGQSSLIGSTPIQDVVEVQRCTSDPIWSELGDDWPEVGVIQLWAIDPLSGSARVLLGEVDLPLFAECSFRLLPGRILLAVDQQQELELSLSAPTQQDMWVDLDVMDGSVASVSPTQVLIPAGASAPTQSIHLTATARGLTRLRVAAADSSVPPLYRGVSVFASGAATPGSVLSVSAGGMSTCALLSDRTLTCWGKGGTGQARPPGGEFVQVAMGKNDSVHANHACALRADGTVECWGFDIDGATAPPAGPFTRLWSGGSHSCGMRPDASVECWGSNLHGQTDVPDGPFLDLSAGQFHNCGIRPDQSIECWGLDYLGQTSPPAGEFIQVSTATSHSCALRPDGRIVCWGNNGQGQTSAPSGEFIEVVAGGWNYLNLTCALRVDGRPVCWGFNDAGQAEPPDGQYSQLTIDGQHGCAIRANDGALVCWGLDGSYGRISPPRADYEVMSTGAAHFCAIQHDGNVRCHGENIVGQASPPAGEFVQVSAGSASVYAHSCGVRIDGSVACWGHNAQGQSSPPNGEFLQVSAGGSHTCGVRVDGRVSCWGHNSAGQASPPDGLFTQVSAGGGHSCGIRADRQVQCWGTDSEGQLSVPSGEFTQISARDRTTCGLRADGSVDCWGVNYYGQASPPPGAFTSVESGSVHSCGIRPGGAVECWGRNAFGVISPAPGLYTTIDVGDHYSCGITIEGVSQCWGLHTAMGKPVLMHDP